MPSPPAPVCSPASTHHARRWPRVVITLSLLALAGLGGWFWQSRGERDWRLAQDALQRHDLALAAAHLEACCKDRPGDADAWYLAARTARRLGRHAQAEEHLKRCQEIGGVTEATRLEWNLLRVQQGDLGDVHTRLRMTTTPDHPDAPLVLEALARGYLRCDRLYDAMEACDLWIARAPDQPWPFLRRGGIFEKLANFDRALADYRRALEIVPEDQEVRLALGMLLARGRQPGPASEHFQHVLDRSADNAPALLGLAACRIEQGRSEEARLLLDRVLAADPRSARALCLRGRATLDQDDPAGAAGWLNQAVQQAPDNTEALHLLILSLRRQRRNDEAERLAPRLEALQRDTARLDELVRSVARKPDDAALRREAGETALRIGRHEEGVRWLESALRARGDHRPVHAALAAHFRQKGDVRAEHHGRLAQTP